MTRPRILFVDDERRILDGIRRSLRDRRQIWDMAFAGGGAEALAILSDDRYDVVISDMRMPGIDGAELLTRVSELYPATARVVLSGHTERDSALQVAVTAHRFLNKPCEPDVLTAVLEQLTLGTTTGRTAQLRHIAGGVRSLPILAQAGQRLQLTLNTPTATLSDAVDAVRDSPALTAKLLQLSNSTFFGSRPRVASVGYALTSLGLPTVQALVSPARLRADLPDLDEPLARALDASQRHAVAASRLAAALATPAHAQYAEAAALLQDVGRLACLLAAPDRQVAGTPRSETFALDADGAEPAELRCCDVGAELLHLWGLPRPIVNAVAQCYAPHEAAASGLAVAGTVRAAHLLLQETEARDPLGTADEDELAQLLEHPQLQAREVDWRKVAAEAAAVAVRRCAA